MIQLEALSLSEIKKYDSTQIKDYYQELEKLKTNRISKRVVENLIGEPLLKIVEEVSKEEEQFRSYQYFPGDLILLYSNFQEKRSRNYTTCDFSGALIYPGSLYINYRPLIDNLTLNETFILKKTIKVESSFAHRIPTNILELEVLENKMLLESEDPEIDFSHFNRQMRGDIRLQKLKRRRKNENRNR